MIHAVVQKELKDVCSLCTSESQGCKNDAFWGCTHDLVPIAIGVVVMILMLHVRPNNALDWQSVLSLSQSEVLTFMPCWSIPIIGK